MEIWNYPTGDKVRSSPAISNGFVYFGSYDNKVYCLSLEGDFQWSYTTDGDVKTAPVVADNKVFFGSSNGKLYCVDAEGNGDGTTDIIWDWDSASFVVGPSYADGRIYFSAGGSVTNFYCVDAATGDDIWNQTTSETVSGGYISLPAIAEDKVYVSEEPRTLHCFYANNGTELWSFSELDIFKPRDVSIYDGIVYVAEAYYDSNVFAFQFNRAPEKPEITGPSEGIVNEEISFDIVAIDPDGNDLTYQIDWGNGDPEEIGPFSSGEIVTVVHEWTESGTYDITVTAKDGYYFSEPAIHTIDIVELPEFNVDFTGGKGLTVTISNIGNSIATDVEWSMTITGGLIMLPRGDSGIIKSIESDESEDVTINILGIGIGIITEMPSIEITITCTEGVMYSESTNAKIVIRNVNLI